MLLWKCLHECSMLQWKCLHERSMLLWKCLHECSMLLWKCLHECSMLLWKCLLECSVLLGIVPESFSLPVNDGFCFTPVFLFRLVFLLKGFFANLGDLRSCFLLLVVLVMVAVESPDESDLSAVSFSWNTTMSGVQFKIC